MPGYKLPFDPFAVQDFIAMRSISPGDGFIDKPIGRAPHPTPNCSPCGQPDTMHPVETPNADLSGADMSVDDYLEFRHLKYIKAIAEEGSFTRAAEQVRVAQSAMSKQIRDLEDVLEIRVFDRTREGCNPTPAGLAVVSYAHQMIQMRKELIETVGAIHRNTLLPLRLGIAPNVHQDALNAVYGAYKDIFPGSSIVPTCALAEEIPSLLECGSIDIGVATLPLEENRFNVRVMMRERFMVCMRCDDELVAKDTIDPQDVDGKLRVFSDEARHPHAHSMMMEMLKSANIRPHSVSPTFSAALVEWMVKENGEYALIGEHSRLQGGVILRPIENLDWTIDSAVIYDADNKQSSVRLLARQLERRADGGSPRPEKKPSRAARPNSTAISHGLLDGLR